MNFRPSMCSAVFAAPANPRAWGPLHDPVVIRRNDAEEKTTGGIIIPESGKADGGVVVAAGSGARDEQRQIVALHVKSGDHILFGKWVGHRGEAR